MRNNQGSLLILSMLKTHTNESCFGKANNDLQIHKSKFYIQFPLHVSLLKALPFALDAN